MTKHNGSSQEYVLNCIANGVPAPTESSCRQALHEYRKEGFPSDWFEAVRVANNTFKVIHIN